MLAHLLKPRSLCLASCSDHSSGLRLRSGSSAARLLPLLRCAGTLGGLARKFRCFRTLGFTLDTLRVTLCARALARECFGNASSLTLCARLDLCFLRLSLCANTRIFLRDFRESPLLNRALGSKFSIAPLLLNASALRLFSSAEPSVPREKFSPQRDDLLAG